MAPSYILVTGATGFIGAHVVDNLLRRGLRVRATSRSQETADKMLAARPEYASKLDFIITGDMTSPGCFDDAVKGGIDGVIHCASPVAFKFKDNERDAIIPAISGVASILHSVAQTPSITRIVITSSMAAIFNPYITTYPPGFVYTADHWSPVTREEGIKAGEMLAYRAGKKLAELAAWDYIKEHKPHFDIATMLEPMVYGPPANPLERMDKINASNGVISQIMDGKYPESRKLVHVCVDVRDVAEAHALALLKPDAGGRRYLLSNDKWSFGKVADVLLKNFEWAKERVKPLEGDDLVDAYDVDGKTAAEQLGFEYTPFEETIVDAFTAWKEIQDKECR